MIRKSTTKIYTRERRLFYGALSCVLVLFAAYVYCVSASVAHAVMRKELNEEIRETEMHMSELEVEYIEAKDSVATELLEERGFTENEDKVFVTKRPANLVLSKNDEG